MSPISVDSGSPKRAKSPVKVKKIEENENKTPFRGFVMIATIQPSNTFKKTILSQVAGKELTKFNCNMMKSYFTAIKYNLFDCKPALSIKVLIEQE